MAKPRVHEIAAEMGVESKVALATLQEMGEFVKTASSSVEPRGSPPARRTEASCRPGRRRKCCRGTEAGRSGSTRCAEACIRIRCAEARRPEARRSFGRAEAGRSEDRCGEAWSRQVGCWQGRSGGAEPCSVGSEACVEQARRGCRAEAGCSFGCRANAHAEDR